MQRTRTWRDVLEVILRDRQEMQRVASELDVSSAMLQRWVRGEANPRIHQVQHLLQALPQHQKALLPLLAEEFEEGIFNVPEQRQEIEEIPSIFYAQVLRGSTTVPPAIRFWSLASIVLQQILMQLDPLRKGLQLSIARFLPPGMDGKLYCLYEAILQGTASRVGDLSQCALLLGAESLAGKALAEFRPLVINEQSHDRWRPTMRIEHEASALAFPISRGNRVAGALLISSTQEGYFTTDRLSLLHRYIDLLTLAFEGEDFYDLEQLNLAVMPEMSEQRQQLSTFHQRVASQLRQAVQQQQTMDTAQAELRVWQQLAEEFLLQTR